MKNKIFSVSLVTLLLWTMFMPMEASAQVSTSAQGAILIEQESGRVLYEKNAHTQMRIASITKIMTAILAIESGKLDEKVVVSSNAFGTEGSSLYLQQGEKVVLEDLVYGLMLRSGNDAAVAIAEHVGGSLESFVYMMNEKAKELGMSKTVFSNPHGLDDHEEHYSTAYDMALLTRYAMKNETYREISGTKTYRSAQEGEDWDRIWHNKNKLLTQLYKYSTGGKTGYTKRAKRTLVSTATKDDFHLIAVTLNAPSDWNDHMGMFNWGFDTFELHSIVQEGIIENINNDFYREKVSATYSFEYPLASNELNLLETKITLYEPPKNNEWETDGIPNPVGKIIICLGDDCIGEVPLQFIGEIDPSEKGFWSKLFDMIFMTMGVNRDG